MAPPASSAPSSSKSASARPAASSSTRSTSARDLNRSGVGPSSAPDSADPVLPDFSSLVPHHLDVLEGLPTNLRYLYSKITELQHELDSQLDHIHASTTAVHASIRDRIVSTNYRAGVKVDMHMAANQAFSHLAGTTIQQCQRTAQRKVDLATYAYELVDRCVLKLDEELKAAGLPIQDAYPVILAAVSSSSGASGVSGAYGPSAAAAGTVAAAIAQAHPPASPRKAAASSSAGEADTHVSTGARSSRKRSRASTPVSEHPAVHPSLSSASPEKPKKIDKKQKTSTAAAASNSNSTRRSSSQKSVQRKSSARDATTDDGAGEDADDGSASDATAEHFSTPVDPNEPLYCTCQSVAHGEMVACDDADCPYEWFHYACVGLTKAPKGQWYCSECSLKKKRQKKH